MHIARLLKAKGPSVRTVSPEATIQDALALLAEHQIGALVVSADGETIAGILSERDIVRSLAQDLECTPGMRVSELMTADVHTCSPDAKTAELMSLMTEKRIRHVPVVTDGKLAGLVSIGDVVSARLAELEEEREQIEAYITTS